KVPQTVEKEYNTQLIVVFQVNEDGSFSVLHVNTPFKELADESKRVFSIMPKAKPAQYNGNPIYSKYNIKFSVPLQQPTMLSLDQSGVESSKPVFVKTTNTALTELDSIKTKDFTSPHLKSHLNIPFTHSYYAQYDRAMNQVGANNHTAQKPYTYAEVAKYYDLEQAQKELYFDTESWVGKKLWNENFATFQGENYWFILNPVLDLRYGEDSDSDIYTYNNT